MNDLDRNTAANLKMAGYVEQSDGTWLKANGYFAATIMRGVPLLSNGISAPGWQVTFRAQAEQK